MICESFAWSTLDNTEFQLHFLKNKQIQSTNHLMLWHAQCISSGSRQWEKLVETSDRKKQNPQQYTELPIKMPVW